MVDPKVSESALDQSAAPGSYSELFAFDDDHTYGTVLKGMQLSVTLALGFHLKSKDEYLPVHSLATLTKLLQSNTASSSSAPIECLLQKTARIFPRTRNRLL